MPRRVRVIPYRTGSRSATALARSLGGMCLRLGGRSQFNPRPGDLVINWGNTDAQMYRQASFNNTDLRAASNKREFFIVQREAGNQDIIPRFWTDRNEIPDDAFPIVCRTVLAGHSGEGIVIANDRNELVNAPLYVQYVKKTEEFRVHVGRDLDNPDESIIIDVQQKRRRHDHDDPNWQIRNHANGFIYAREDINPAPEVLAHARRALLATDLDFGAVDVIFSPRNGTYVLEINTAPGLEGSTLDSYVRYFNNEI